MDAFTPAKAISFFGTLKILVRAYGLFTFVVYYAIAIFPRCKEESQSKTTFPLLLQGLNPQSRLKVHSHLRFIKQFGFFLKVDSHLTFIMWLWFFSKDLFTTEIYYVIAILYLRSIHTCDLLSDCDSFLKVYSQLRLQLLSGSTMSCASILAIQWSDFFFFFSRECWSSHFVYFSPS